MLIFVGALVIYARDCCAATFAWPAVALPKDAVSHAIGDKMTANGIPMRVQGFFVQTSQETTTNWFRERLGRPIVENNLGRAVVLGRAEGEYYVTVQLSPAPSGTSGLVIVSHLKAAYDNRDRRKVAMKRLLSRLPGNSKLLTELESADGSKLSRFYILSNSYHEDVNRDYIIDLMREDGLNLLHRAEAPARTSPPGARNLSNGAIFIFGGDRREAIAVVGRNATGQTIVQVNVISEMARYK